MRSIREQAKNMLVAGEFNLIVCGGGPGGFSAAVAAANEVGTYAV